MQQVSSDFWLDQETLQSFDALREQAVAQASGACLLDWPELALSFGPRSREFCNEHMAYHFDFLRPALASGELSLFTSYLGWLRQVLGTRGVPDKVLVFSLDQLASFFRQQLGACADPIVAALQAGKQALAAGIETTCFGHSHDCTWPESESFQRALLRGDRREAKAVFNQVLDREGSYAKVAVGLVQPAMYEVGRLWQENKASVFQEHLASAIVQTLLSQAYGEIELVTCTDRKALFACVAGNEHSIGLRIVSDSFELAGWSVGFLGANTPRTALLNQVRAFQPELLGLSVSMSFHLKELRETVQVLRATFAADCPRIAIGGLVINQFPALAHTIGAELLGEDAIQARYAAELAQS